MAQAKTRMTRTLKISGIALLSSIALSGCAFTPNAPGPDPADWKRTVTTESGETVNCEYVARNDKMWCEWPEGK